MVPANGQSWWYYGVTGPQVGQLLTQNNAILTDIDAYIDADNSLKFIVTMAPATGAGWGWWWGQTADSVGAILAQYNATLTKVSPYIDTDDTLKFAIIVTVPAQPSPWWWYYGLTGDQILANGTANNAMLTDIRAYIDVDATVKFAVIMVPSQGTWWWWEGASGDQVNQMLTQNNAMPTDISAYTDPADNTLKFAVIMAPSQGQWWWSWGQSGAGLGQQLAQNNAQLTAASGYLTNPENSITFNGYPNVSGLNGQMTLVIQESGAYSFSGSWSPSNWFTGLISQDVNFVSTLLDVRGTAWVFSTSGTVPVEGTYSFNNTGTNASLAENWQFIQAGITGHDQVNAGLDLGATWNDIVNWYNQNQQTINGVVQVVGDIVAAVA